MARDVGGILRLLRQIFLFGLIGVVGFVADTAVLYALKPFWDLYSARAVSFVCAVWVTWLLNRNVTFKSGKTENRAKEFAVYFGYMLFGGIANFLVYGLLVKWHSLTHMYPVIGVAAGSLAGMLVNFTASKFFIFQNR